jgi:hypothetical protein
MMKKRNSPKLLNKEYFISLANTRGSVGMLRMQSMFLLVLSIIGLVPGMEIHSWYYNIISTIVYGVLKFYVVYAVLLNIGLFLVSQKSLYKHQVLTSILLFFTLLTELVILVALSFMISNGKSTGYKSNIADFSANYSTIYLIIIGVVSLLTTCYNIFWIKMEISKGFSEKRVIANYFAFSKIFNSSSFWIIFGVVSVAGIIFTNSLFVLGLVLGLIFVLAFPRLLIEIGYLIYLKIVDKDYWEENGESNPLSLNKKLLLILKSKLTYVLIGFFIIVVMVQIDEKYNLSRAIKNVFGVIAIIILIGFAAIFIQWFIRKMKKKKTGGTKK